MSLQNFPYTRSGSVGVKPVKDGINLENTVPVNWREITYYFLSLKTFKVVKNCSYFGVFSDSG